MASVCLVWPGVKVESGNENPAESEQHSLDRDSWETTVERN